MKITKSMLLELDACNSAMYKYFTDVDSYDAKELLNLALKNEDYSYTQWCIARLMPPMQRVAWAIFCAEQVIKIYEDKYPDDPRPRNAINAAKKYHQYPTDENKACAAWSAARAESAANAAWSTANVAWSAANAVSATSAAWSAASAARANKKMQTKLMRKGFLILTTTAGSDT